MKKVTSLFLSLMISTICTYGQQLFQDASGNTQISLNNQSLGYIFYNTTDKSAIVGYTRNNNLYNAGGYDWTGLEADYIYGIDLKVKTTEGIGNFFNKDAINPGFTLGLNGGFCMDNFLNDGHILNLIIRPTLSYNQYAYIHTEAPDYSLDKVKKVEVSVLLNLSTQFNNGGKIKGKMDRSKQSTFFGLLQTGFKQVNNYEDLDDGQISTILSQSGTSAIQTIKTGKLGNYERSNVLPLNLDFAFTPRLFKTNYIGFNTYYRTNFFKKVNTSNAGLGIYLANPKKPSQISGGIGWQFNDLYDKLNKGTDLISRSSAFFYVGYAIGAK